MVQLTERYGSSLARHADDVSLDGAHRGQHRA
jgi:hypothetical protein